MSMRVRFNSLKDDGARFQCTFYSGEDRCNHNASRLIDFESMKSYNEFGRKDHITILRALCESHINSVVTLVEGECNERKV